MTTSSAFAETTHQMTVVYGAEGAGYVPHFGHRYLSEDVPTGLCFTKGIACLLRVRTSWIDKVLWWSQEKLGREFITKDGRMEGKDVASTRAPQAYGVRTRKKLGREFITKDGRME